MATARRTFSLTAWIRPRLRTLVGVTLGSTSWAAAFALAWHFWAAAPPVPAAERVAYALQLVAWPALVLLPMIAACFRLFDTDRAEDPLAGAESRRFRINQRVLTNTVEQGAVFVLLVLALATRLPPQHLKLLPIAVTIWCVGRLLFWAGYHVAPAWRAPGFDWTFYTSALLAAWFLYTTI
jgi:MAPEG family